MWLEMKDEKALYKTYIINYSYNCSGNYLE